MFQNELLSRIAKNAPVTVMARALFENVLNPKSLDSIFQRHVRTQRQRSILFSFLVELMLLVACQIRPRIHSAYKAWHEQLPFTVDAVYDKIAGIELPVSEALVRETSEKIVDILREVRPPQPELIPGYRLRIVDGNKIAATDRRLKVLRGQNAAPLPGFALVVFEPAWNLITHAVLCQDGHAQERSLFPQLVKLAKPGDLWLEDRNFCCWNFLHGVISRGAHLLVRQHAGSIRWKATSELVHCGTTATGEVWEQLGYVEDVETLKQLPLRRIELRLNEPTRDGDTTLGLLTNLPADVSAVQVAEAYPKRWQIETAFQEIEALLSGEINTLGYPEAALFSLSCAYVAYNILQCIRLTLEASMPINKEQPKAMEQPPGVEQSMAKEQPSAKEQPQGVEISLYYIADDVAHTMRGLDAVLPHVDWEIFRNMTASELAMTLRTLTMLVPLRKYTKRRKNKQPNTTPRPSPKQKKHVSTAKLLNKIPTKTINFGSTPKAG